MVYSSSPDGHLVDKKGYNWHMSARPTDGTTNVAGASAFTLTTVGDIPAGAVVIEDGTAGRVDISVGAASEAVLGIAISTRQNDDARPLSYTILGVVEVIAGETIVAGDYLCTEDTEAYYGAVAKWEADFDNGNAESLVAMKKKIGKALTGASAGGRFWAYVNFMG